MPKFNKYWKEDLVLKIIKQIEITKIKKMVNKEVSQEIIKKIDFQETIVIF